MYVASKSCKFLRIKSILHPFTLLCSVNAVEFDTTGAYEQALNEIYATPESGHKLLIIQPRLKFPHRSENVLTGGTILKYSPDEEEARALVDSLENWSSVDTVVCNLRTVKTNPERFFTTGVWDDLCHKVESYRDAQFGNTNHNDGSSNSEKCITGVFVNWTRLTTRQLITMHHAWKLPVYDRYTLVVQLFNTRARTSEARIQAKLAEIGLLRARLPAFTDERNSIAKFSASIRHSVASDNRSNEHLIKLIDKKESRLLNLFENINKHRRNHIKQRLLKRIHNLPIVTVVGYTNAGKTSLIRCLSGSHKLQPSPKVFTTLDITHHRARLSDHNAFESERVGLPGLQLILLDTIGFMSDLPISLLAAFRATLDECLETDLILHVIDIGQGEWQAKCTHVENLLANAGIRRTPVKETTDKFTQTDAPLLLRVGNKVDKLSPNLCLDEFKDIDVLISTELKTGISELTTQIRSIIFSRLGWFRRMLEVDQGSDCLDWIYSNAMVTSVNVAPSNPQRVRITAVFTPANWERLYKLYNVE